jgi:hypothetical protein
MLCARRGVGSTKHGDSNADPSRISRRLRRWSAKEFGFRIAPTIGEALRSGGKTLAVDAVLVIGERGRYDANELGQKKYPRYEFFRQIVDVFRENSRAVPVFNDKHLSWNCPTPNVQYSAMLMSKVEEMLLTGKPPYPVGRTLLTTGILAAAMKSLATSKRLDTPHLAVRYTPPRESTFCQT